MRPLRHDEIHIDDVIRGQGSDWWRVTRVTVWPHKIGLSTVWVPKPGYLKDDGMPGYLSGPADQTRWVLRPTTADAP